MATTFTLDELVTPITAEEFKTSIYTVLGTVGVTTTTWKPGAVTRTIIAVVCVCLAAFSSLVANIARSGFLTLAKGLWAKLHARYVYGVEPDEATFAIGTVLISNASGNVYGLDPDELEVSSSITGKSYRNTEAVTINALASGVAVVFRAVEAGAASSALVGEIDNVVSSFIGLTCTNPGTLIGRDDESEELLKIRCAEKLGSFSPNGPSDAYAVAARGAKRVDGTRIGVTRIRTVPVVGSRIHAYVASASGALTGTVGDLSSDLGAVDEAIQTQAVPLGVTADVFTASDKVINITATVWVYNTTGLTELQIKTAIEDSLRSYFADPITAPIGGNVVPGQPGFMYAEDISAAILRAQAGGASIRAFRAAVTPSAAIPIEPFEVPKLGAIDLTIVRIAPTAGAV
jgi:hypothetical protein